MGFSRQEYWSGSPFPSPGNLPNPGMEPRSPALQVDSLPAGPQGKPLNLKVPKINELLKEKWKLGVRSCLILSDPTDCNLLGSSVYRILQARILEWVAISSYEPWSPALQADSLATREAQVNYILLLKGKKKSLIDQNFL